MREFKTNVGTFYVKEYCPHGIATQMLRQNELKEGGGIKATFGEFMDTSESMIVQLTEKVLQDGKEISGGEEIKALLDEMDQRNFTAISDYCFSLISVDEADEQERKK